jgi:hypothetical protein
MAASRSNEAPNVSAEARASVEPARHVWSVAHLAIDVALLE